MQTAKQAAQQIIGQLQDQASWDDIMYELYVKQKLEQGLTAITEGRTISHDEAKKRILCKVGCRFFKVMPVSKNITGLQTPSCTGANTKK